MKKLFSQREIAGALADAAGGRVGAGDAEIVSHYERIMSVFGANTA